MFVVGVPLSVDEHRSNKFNLNRAIPRRGSFFESCKITGGDKPRPYLLAEGSPVGAGFIPARKGLYFK
jgi:hypothetical protein